MLEVFDGLFEGFVLYVEGLLGVLGFGLLDLLGEEGVLFALDFEEIGGVGEAVLEDLEGGGEVLVGGGEEGEFGEELLFLG